MITSTLGVPRWLLGAIALPMLVACVAPVAQRRALPEPAEVPVPPMVVDGPPVALVLSGGSARGFAHVGVLKVLEANGIRPDIVVGSSAGSIVGALYASGLTAVEVEAAMYELDSHAFRDFVVPWPRIGTWPGELGLLRGNGLRNFVGERIRHSLTDDFPVRFAAVATDLGSGAPVAFNSGDAALAVLASCAVPGVISPPHIGGRPYGDGQMSSPLPVDEARRLGATFVIAVDVLYPPADASLTSVFSVLFQAFVISTNRLKDYQIRGADFRIKPAIAPTTGQLSFSSAPALVEAGESAARAELPRLLQLLRRAGKVASSKENPRK